MRKWRFSEHQIVRILKFVEGGRTVKDVCREVWREQRHVLQMKVQVRRLGSIRHREDERP